MDIDLSGPPDLTTLHSAVVKLVQGHQDHERRILESERVRSELQHRRDRGLADDLGAAAAAARDRPRLKATRRVARA